MDQGYIRLFRKIQESRHWPDKNFSKFEAFIDLLFLARFKDTTIKRTDKHGPYELSYGDALVSERFLAKRWEWSTKKVRTWLNLCLEDGTIMFKERSTKRSIVHLANMQVYAEWRRTERSAKDSTEEAQKTHSGSAQEAKKNKETPLSPETPLIKKEKKPSTKAGYTEDFEKFWNLYPKNKRKEKQQAFKAWKLITKEEKELAIGSLPNHVESIDWKKNNGQFIIYPERFIKRKKWEDEVQTGIQTTTGKSIAEIVNENYNGQ